MVSKLAGPFLAALLGSIAACSTQQPAVGNASVHQLPVDATTLPGLDIKHSPALGGYLPDEPRRPLKPVIATVLVCVGPDGHVSGMPSIRKSTGVVAFDKAILRWASAATFFPGSYYGKAVKACVELNVALKSEGAVG